MPLQHLKNTYLTKNLSFYRKWRIRTQISCFGFLIFSLTCIITYFATYILLSMVSSIFSRDFELILKKVNQNQLSIDVQIQKRMITNYFDNDIRMILQMNDVFHFSQRNDLIIDPPIDCFDQNKFLLDEKFGTSIFCWFYQNNSQREDEEQLNNLFLNFTSLMNEIRMMNALEQQYFVSIGQSNFAAIIDIFQKQSSIGNIQISERQWYKDHIKYMDNQSKIIQSQPYLAFDKIVSFALTTNLTAINNTLLGIAGQNQNLKTIQNINIKDFNFSVINKEEQIIISPLYQLYHYQIFTIYDRLDLELNKTFWNYLQQNAQEDHFTFYFNDTYLMSIMYVDNLQFYILLERNIYQETQKQEEYFQKMYTYFERSFTFILYLYSFLIILFTVIYYILIKIISQDIYDIMNTTKLHLYSKNYSVFTKKITINKSKIQYKLYQAFLNLIYHRKQRNPICFDIEKYTYPQKTYFEQIHTNVFEYHHIKNNHKEFTSMLSFKCINNEIRKQSINNHFNLEFLDLMKK